MSSPFETSGPSWNSDNNKSLKHSFNSNNEPAPWEKSDNKKEGTKEKLIKQPFISPKHTKHKYRLNNSKTRSPFETNTQEISKKRDFIKYEPNKKKSPFETKYGSVVEKRRALYLEQRKKRLEKSRLKQKQLMEEIAEKGRQAKKELSRKREKKEREKQEVERKRQEKERQEQLELVRKKEIEKKKMEKQKQKDKLLRIKLKKELKEKYDKIKNDIEKQENDAQNRDKQQNNLVEKIKEDIKNEGVFNSPEEREKELLKRLNKINGVQELPKKDEFIKYEKVFINSLPMEKIGNMTYCSRTARKNLYRLGVDRKLVPVGESAKASMDMYLNTKRYSNTNYINNIGNMPEGTNVLDLFIDSSSKYEHRAAAYKVGKQWYVLDPYSKLNTNYKNTTKPIPMSEYMSAKKIMGIFPYIVNKNT